MRDTGLVSRATKRGNKGRAGSCIGNRARATAEVSRDVWLVCTSSDGADDAGDVCPSDSQVFRFSIAVSRQDGAT